MIDQTAFPALSFHEHSFHSQFLFAMADQLRDYQERIVERVSARFAEGYRAPLVVAPTGAGKTVMFCWYARQAFERGLRVLILVHRRELLKQTHKALVRAGVPHGLIRSGSKVTNDLVQVALVGTLAKRLDKYIAPDLIIVDEAHHVVAGTWLKIVSAYPNAQIIGFTATPRRADKKPLGVYYGGVFDCIVEGPTTAELQAQGFLSRALVYGVSSPPDLSQVRVGKDGEFVTEEFADVIDKPSITGCAIEHYQRICDGAPTIVFCFSVEHGEHVAEQFRQAGYTAANVHGGMSDEDRERTMQDFEAGRITILTSCDLISEGYDCPAVTTVILLRPTNSLSTFLQQVGRALRLAPGKVIAYILDHVGNSDRHGDYDAPRNWELGGKPPKDPDCERCVQCPHCYAQFRGNVCAGCGMKLTVAKVTYGPDPREREIEEREGQLVLRNEQDLTKKYHCFADIFAALDEPMRASLNMVYDAGLLLYALSNGQVTPSDWEKYVSLPDTIRHILGSREQEVHALITRCAGAFGYQHFDHILRAIKAARSETQAAQVCGLAPVAFDSERARRQVAHWKIVNRSLIDRREQGRARTREDLIALAIKRGNSNPEKWADIVLQSREEKEKRNAS